MAESRAAISELTRDQLVVWFDKHGEPAYRAKQIRRHATHGTERGFEELTDLPKSPRDSLARSFRWSSVEPVRDEASADREPRKALLELRAGNYLLGSFDLARKDHQIAFVGGVYKVINNVTLAEEDLGALRPLEPRHAGQARDARVLV